MHLFAKAAVCLLIVLPLVAGASADSGAPANHLFILGSSPQDDILLPSAWAGIWQTTEQTYDCIGDTLIETWEGLDTLCTGDLLVDSDEMPVECTMEFDGSTLTYDCAGTLELEECTVDYHMYGTWTVEGETLTSVYTFSIDYADECGPFFLDICRRTEVSAVKIGPEPPECEDTPIRAMDWGEIKALYR